MAGGETVGSNKLRELALALTENERKELLRKIAGSLSLKSPEGRDIYAQEIAPEERQTLMADEISGLSIWRRIVYFFRRLVSTKPDDQTYIEFRLSELRKRIRSVCPGLMPVEYHTVREEFARIVWDLYKAAYPLIPMFLDLWRSKEYLQQSVEHLLSQRIPAARSDLDDFVSMEELQSAFLEHEQKGDVRKLVVERLHLYLEEVPDDLFQHLEEGILPFYFLKGLCLFDYNAFFDVFGFDPGITPPEEMPPFREAPTSAVLPHIEQLYYGLYSAGRLERGFYVHSEMIDRYLELKERDGIGLEDADGSSENGDASERTESPSESAYQERRSQVQESSDYLSELLNEGFRVGRRLPFVELMRFLRRDPYYRVSVYLPTLKLREFYHSYLMIRILSELDERFPEIRRGVVDRMVEEVFGGTPPPFAYFRPGVQIASAKLGLPDFRHMRSLNLLYSFLRFVYRGRMQEMVRTLARVLPSRQRETAGDLLIHVSGTEATLADLEHFDESFSPDSEDGRAFYRIRYAVEKDVTLHRSYRNIVQQKDREARGLVDRGMEHLRGMISVCTVILQGLSDQFRQSYADIDSRVNSIDGLDRLLDLQLGKLVHFETLMKQAIVMEEGY